MLSISVNGYFFDEIALTQLPMTDMPRRMGRPPLSKESGTKMTGVRLTEDVRQRIIALVGENRMAAFIREAIALELERREKAAKKPE